MSEFDLGSYRAEIIIDDSQFDSSMNNAEGKIESVGKKSSLFGASLGTLATGAIAGLGVALVGAGVAGVSMADDLQKALNGLQASTGMTDDEMRGMEDSLKNIYNNNYGESFQDIADSMAIVKQNTGLTGKELETTTQNALALRDTFEFDVGESTNAANSLMKQFGITSDQAFNLIAQGAQNGANKNGDLIDSLNEYAPQFKAMGFSAEQFTNVLIDGAKNGAFSIDKVGDAMKEFNIRSKDLSKTSLDAFKSLGFNGEQMSASFAKGGSSAQQAFSKVMTALNNVKDPIEKNRIGVELFGTQFEDLEAKGIASLANIGTNASLSKNALEQINQVKYDSFGQAVQGIGRNLNTGLIMPIGQMLLPYLNKFASWIMEQMPTIQSVFNTVFTAIGTAVSTVYNWFKNNILPIFSNFGTNVSSIFPVVKSVIETVFNAVVTVATTVWNFFKVNLLPIFLSLYNWISSNMPTIRSTMQSVFNAIVSVVSRAWGFFKNNLLPILSSLFQYVQDKMPQIKSIMEKVFGIIKNVVQVAWDIFSNYLLPVLSELWEFIEPYLPKIGSIVKKAFDTIFDVVDKTVGVFEDVTGAIKTALEWLTFWDDKKPKKKTLEIEEKTTSSGKTASYDVGTPYVPNDQLALIHKGEAIIPAKYNPFNTSNSTRNVTPTSNTNNNFNINFKVDKMTGSQKDAEFFLSQIVKGVSARGVKM
ncbi:phage tail tape measure protein [Neobacillus drentensis]|uniref:phage tail tape measure protein n=1 Tax=Neobacillus drentensis TaxID=220684 RepID=UPI002FFDD107